MAHRWGRWLAATALAAATPAAALAGDLQAWGGTTVTAPVTGKLSASMEAQARLTGDVSRLGQLILRPSIGWRVADRHTLSLGYAYVRSEPGGTPVTNEHRLWQQAVYGIVGSGEGVMLDGRTRLEQRFVEGKEGTGWRLRQQLRLTAPVAGVRAVLWSEPFYNIDDAGWGQRQGFDQLRAFAGVNLKVNDMVTVEPGYLHQRVFRRGEDRINHVASLSMNVRL